MKLLQSATILSASLLMATGAFAQVPAEPTFADDIAPIFYDWWISCHRPDQIAPM